MRARARGAAPNKNQKPKKRKPKKKKGRLHTPESRRNHAQMLNFLNRKYILHDILVYLSEYN